MNASSRARIVAWSDPASLMDRHRRHPPRPISVSGLGPGLVSGAAASWCRAFEPRARIRQFLNLSASERDPAAIALGGILLRRRAPRRNSRIPFLPNLRQFEGIQSRSLQGSDIGTNACNFKPPLANASATGIFAMDDGIAFER